MNQLPQQLRPGLIPAQRIPMQNNLNQIQYNNHQRMGVPMMPIAPVFTPVQPLYMHQNLAQATTTGGIIQMRTLNAGQPPSLYQPPIPEPVPETEKEVTLFLGQLPEKFTDEFMENILNLCGTVKSFKRPQYKFAFVDFVSPEGALRAKTVLAGLRYRDRSIIIRVGEEAENQLETFQKDLKEGKINLTQAVDTTEDASLSVLERLENRHTKAFADIKAVIDESKLKDVAIEMVKSKPRSRSSSRKRKRKEKDSKKRGEGRDRRRRRKRSRSKERSSKKRKVVEPVEKKPRDTKELVDLVPKETKHVFGYELDWKRIVEAGLVEKKMRFWISDRLKQYLGGHEDSELTDFVVGFLTERTKPAKIVSEMEAVLAEESKIFVVKMWRRLIFETLKITHDIKT